MPFARLSDVLNLLQCADPFKNSSRCMPRYLVEGDGEILTPAILILVIGRGQEGFRKITSSVLAAFSEILLARSHL